MFDINPFVFPRRCARPRVNPTFSAWFRAFGTRCGPVFVGTQLPFQLNIMIRICIILEETNAITSVVASTADGNATHAEKHYLREILASLGREKNPVHLQAEALVAKYQQERKKPGQP